MTSGKALADGFALYEYSARGVALSGAVMARKPDPSAVAYNPALLTRLPGVHVAAGSSFINPRGRMEWDDSLYETTRLKHSVWPIPHAYYTHQINDDWTFGVGEFTRYGLGFEYPSHWPGRFSIYDVALLSASINPVIAWRATDKLSLAAGVEIVYVTLDLKKRAKFNQGLPSGATPMEVDADIKDANAFGIGGNVAMHYQFNDQWAVGAHYRSQVRVHAHGDIRYKLIDSGSYGPSGPTTFDQVFKNGGADSTVILPDSVAAGISWTPTPEFSLEVGAIWTRWSTFRSLNISVPSPVDKTYSPKHWRDSWRFNAGAEWDALDWLTLRVGYAYDQSPIRAPYDDYLVPTGNRHIYSGGLGFNWDAWTLDLAYSIIVPICRSYRDNPETGTLKSKTHASYTQIVAFTLAYEF